VTVWVVAGPAGAGKSTLGRALARRTGAVLLDLDTVTNPLLDALAPLIAPDGHWNDAVRRALVRPARYAALLATARDQVAPDLVLVAPFTAELRGGEEWATLRDAIAPAEPVVVWLDASPELLEERLADRSLDRDVHARPGVERPAVPHVLVDAARPTEEQVSRVLD
jgi:adenylylsulfate kinase-like enzyme